MRWRELAPSSGNSQATHRTLYRLEHVTKADLNKRPAQVSAMFDEVAEGYDRTNAVLSMGNATLWRVATTKAVGPVRGERILDVAAGTGTSSASLAASGAQVVAADFSPGMINVGRKRQAHVSNIEFVEADATALPFADNEFDAVTISFGLRNVVEPKKALAEFYRVTKPGGRVVICEFSTPPVGVVRFGYGCYQKFVMPTLVKLASTNDSAYDYLNESIREWPAQRKLAAWLKAAGFESVAYRNLTLGVVALHRGVKPLHAVSSDGLLVNAKSGADAEGEPTAKAESKTAAKIEPAADAKAKAKAKTDAKPTASVKSQTKAAPKADGVAKPKAAAKADGAAKPTAVAKPKAESKPAKAAPKPQATPKPKPKAASPEPAPEPSSAESTELPASGTTP